ncbi:MAG TPA: MarR family winged helix-turn-helix transcriptional regulator [Terrimesophilobacter sp.]|nr:MarR family winged helix-turn-helix transcriptional regulator [Terrimesophilobacter sp.]
MNPRSQVGDTPSAVDRIDAALAELRRVGRPHRSARDHQGLRSHAQHRGQREHSRHAGLARHRMLAVLAECPGLGVTEIAEAVGVDQPRASRLVNDATDAGLLRRGPDPRDGRRSVVELTTGGREQLESTLRERRAAVEAGLRGFSTDDAAALAELLERFVVGLRDARGT